MNLLKLSTLCVVAAVTLSACNDKTTTSTELDKSKSSVDDIVANAYVGNDTSDKPYFSAVENATIKSKIVAINKETREVTLELENGEQVTLTTEKDGYNIDKIAVNDIVMVDYMRHITVAVVNAEKGQEGAVEALTLARSEDPTSPGVVAVKEQVVVASVEDINIQDNTFTLKGPEGNLQVYTARNPENLKRSEVGDNVVFSSTEAIMLAVKVTPNL